MRVAPRVKDYERGENWRRTGWIQRININTQVHRLLRPHSFPDLFDDPRRPDRINLAGFGYLKAAVAVVLVVAEAGKCGADAGVDVAVVGEKTLLMRMIEVSSVIDGGLFGGSAAEDFGAPGVAE